MDTGLCFLEPVCNTVCNTVNEQQCRTENRQQCSTVNEQQCSIEQREQCSNVPEERCQVVNEQQCNTVNRQQCDQVLYNYITNAFLVFLGCFWAYVGKPQNHVGWATSMSWHQTFQYGPEIKLPLHISHCYHVNFWTVLSTPPRIFQCVGGYIVLKLILVLCTPYVLENAWGGRQY